jgi:hypothetical protein
VLDKHPRTFQSLMPRRAHVCSFGLLCGVRLVIAVTSVAVTWGGLWIPAVENRAEHARSVFGETLTGK